MPAEMVDKFVQNNSRELTQELGLVIAAQEFALAL